MDSRLGRRMGSEDLQEEGRDVVADEPLFWPKRCAALLGRGALALPLPAVRSVYGRGVLGCSATHSGVCLAHGLALQFGVCVRK